MLRVARRRRSWEEWVRQPSRRPTAGSPGAVDDTEEGRALERGLKHVGRSKLGAALGWLASCDRAESTSGYTKNVNEARTWYSDMQWESTQWKKRAQRVMGKSRARHISNQSRYNQEGGRWRPTGY